MNKDNAIDQWGIIKLYSVAFKKEAWIECISLGYTMLEMGLQYLLQSEASSSNEPISEKRIKKCRYLIELAELALNKDFLPQPIFSEIKEFNDTRRKAIHKLLSGNVKISDLEEAAKQIGPIYGKIQSQWLTITLEPVITENDQ